MIVDWVSMLCFIDLIYIETKCFAVTQPASQPYRNPASQPAFPLPSQPANLTVTQAANLTFTQPASQPFRYPASQPDLPSASQPHTFTSQPAYLTRKPTHRHLACLAALFVYRGELFLTLTFHQNWGGASLKTSECFESGFQCLFSNVFVEGFQ